MDIKNALEEMKNKPQEIEDEVPINIKINPEEIETIVLKRN